MLRKILIPVAFALLIAGCAKEPAATPDEPEYNAALAFTYHSYRTTTRAIAQDHEKVVHDLDIFAFATDGTYIGQLTEGEQADYTETDNGDNTSTIRATRSFLERYAGQTLTFYFVGNNRKSNENSTTYVSAPKHISPFAGTEADFRELLTNPLGNSAWPPYEKAEYIQVTPTSGGLLMTGSVEALLLGKQEIPVTLKRRTARFDIINPAPENFTITGIYISDAMTQGAMFGEATGPHTIAARSIELIDGPGRFDNAHATYDSDNRASGLFYLYPTTIGATTSIVVQGYFGKPANTFNFPVVGNIDIVANNRYALQFDQNTADIIVNIGDYEDGEGNIIIVGP